MFKKSRKNSAFQFDHPKRKQAVARQNENMKILKRTNSNLASLNSATAKGPVTCQVEGEWRYDCCVYRATITEAASGHMEIYTEMTGREFKDRWMEHKSDIRNPLNRQPTRLSAHTWKLKGKEYWLWCCLENLGKGKWPYHTKMQGLFKGKMLYYVWQIWQHP